jgi:hypothetical protein
LTQRLPVGVFICFICGFFYDFRVDFRWYDVQKGNETAILVKLVFFAIAGLCNNVMMLYPAHIVLQDSSEHIAVLN